MSQQLELLTENPSQWTAIVQITPEIQKKEIKPFVALALKELEGSPDSRMSSLQSADRFSAVRAVLRHVARLHSAAGPWRESELAAFLQSLRFSGECVSELCVLLRSERLYERAAPHVRARQLLAALRWRIDVSLSQASLASEQSPDRRKEMVQRHTHVILSLSLGDGQTRTHRLSVAKFHELRFVVASALKSVIVLEKRRCMRKD